MLYAETFNTKSEYLYELRKKTGSPRRILFSLSIQGAVIVIAVFHTTVALILNNKIVVHNRLK